MVAFYLTRLTSALFDGSFLVLKKAMIGSILLGLRVTSSTSIPDRVVTLGLRRYSTRVTLRSCLGDEASLASLLASGILPPRYLID